jgi:hypothetical protein
MDFEAVLFLKAYGTEGHHKPEDHEISSPSKPQTLVEDAVCFLQNINKIF